VWADPGPSLTYETFYGLDERPFSAPPSDLNVLYHSVAHDVAAQQLLAAFRQQKGIVVLTGEAGVGKTMLCRAVAEELGRRTLTAFVSHRVSSIEDLLRTVLVEFGVIARDDLGRDEFARGHLLAATRQQLTSALRSFVASLSVIGASAVVFIKNPQHWEVDLLNQIGDLNAGGGGPDHLQVVLVGEPELVSRLERDDLARLKSLITARIELQPLADDEVAGYVAHSLSRAGSGVRVEFDDGAIAALAAFSRGVPRLINELCAEALTLGQDAAAGVIDAGLVRSGAMRLGVRPPISPTARRLRTALLVVLCVALMMVGAGAAAWVFRDHVARTLISWTRVPPPPAPPALADPEPLAPVPQPPPEPDR
jgi:general secretion pathway protein A